MDQVYVGRTNTIQTSSGSNQVEPAKIFDEIVNNLNGNIRRLERNLDQVGEIVFGNVQENKEARPKPNKLPEAITFIGDDLIIINERLEHIISILKNHFGELKL